MSNLTRRLFFWVALLTLFHTLPGWAVEKESCTASGCNYNVSLDRAGFYIAVVTLPPGQPEGVWSLLINPRQSSPSYGGSFFAGSVLKGNAGLGSWIGFSLADTEPVQITPTDYTGANLPFNVELLLENSMSVYGPMQMTSGQTYTTSPLTPGFYVTNVLSQATAPDTFFGVDITAPSIFGGVVGGWLDSKTGPGYGAFSVSYPQTVKFELLFDGLYDGMGAGQPHLEVYYQKADGTREVYWSAPTSPVSTPSSSSSTDEGATLPPVDPFGFNNNPKNATPISTYPVQVNAALEANVDGDYYRFPGHAGDVISAVLTKTDPNFEPVLSIANSTGRSLPSVNFNISENSPFSAVFTTQLPWEGDYFLVVNEAHSKGDSQFTYTVNIFKDLDFDGLDDNIEVGLGINNQTPDTDHDGIFDAAETKGSPDVDGDGVANWFDLDSDNDGIPDELEGSQDVDGDGLGNFMDTDSDNNNIPDSQEVGTNPNQPLDFDLDGIPDYLDRDDDNDGLLDVNDANRLGRVMPSNILDVNTRVFLASSVVDLGDGQELVNGARVGDKLKLQGDGFAETPAENQVIFSDSTGAINVVPSAATKTMLEVTVPPGAGTRVAVVTRNLQSNWLDLQRLAETAPVLFERQSTITAKTGEIFRLAGLNLNSVTEVNFGGIPTTAFSVVTDHNLEVTIPAEAVSGNVTVKNATGVSNPVALKITQEISGRVVLPAGSPVNVTSLTVSFGLLGEAVPDENGNVHQIQVNKSNMDVVSALLPESGNQPMATFLRAVTLPGDGEVILDSLSTAVALTMTSISIREQVALASMGEARTHIRNLPEVVALASALENALKTDPYFLNNPSNSPSQDLFYEALFKAFKVAQESITALVEAGTLQQRVTRSALRSALTTAVITPEQYDIEVYSMNNSGNVGVENDTQLFLSAQLVDSYTEKTLFSHVSGYADSNIVNAQEGLYYLFSASNKWDYNQPGWRNCRVEVITPGQVRANRTLTPEELTVKDYLQLNLIIQRGVMPPLSLAISFLPLPDAGDVQELLQNVIVDLLLNNASGALLTFHQYLKDGDAVNAIKTLMDVITRDLKLSTESQIVKTIGNTMVKTVAAEAIKEAVKGITKKLVAELSIGWAEKFLDIADMAIVMGKAVDDWMQTPELVTFEVKWPLQITGVTPKVIKTDKNVRLQEKKIEIEGQGFSPIKRGMPFIAEAQWDEYPNVTFIDEGTNNKSPTLPVSGVSISSSGTVMQVYMPDGFRRDAIGPITVKVTHGGAETTAPQKIEVTSEVKVTEANASSDSSNTVDVVGAGFSQLSMVKDNVVTFIKETGEKMNGTVVANSENTLKVMTPSELSSSDKVQVQVQVNNQKPSNTVTLYRFASRKVIFKFDNNGEVNDNTFALFVDGKPIYSMPEPTGNVGPISLELTLGHHLVMLRGIGASDSVSKYSLQITGYADKYVELRSDQLIGVGLAAVVKADAIREVLGTVAKEDTYSSKEDTSIPSTIPGTRPSGPIKETIDLTAGGEKYYLLEVDYDFERNDRPVGEGVPIDVDLDVDI